MSKHSSPAILLLLVLLIALVIVLILETLLVGRTHVEYESDHEYE
ncbi:MAG TPA: hypothetical protein VLC48_05315 [Gemmatimonadota bacterium]|nr:hypothetical protein [Gemmatimonadota bacterium]